MTKHVIYVSVFYHSYEIAVIEAPPTKKYPPRDNKGAATMAAEGSMKLKGILRKKSEDLTNEEREFLKAKGQMFGSERDLVALVMSIIGIFLMPVALWGILVAARELRRITLINEAAYTDARSKGIPRWQAKTLSPVLCVCAYVLGVVVLIGYTILITIVLFFSG